MASRCVGSLQCLAVAGGLLMAPAAVAAQPPTMAPLAEQADRIVVDKSERRMQLMRDGKVLRSYRILLGDAPVGAKRQQGDEKTPEGEYRISGRNPNSRFHLSLRVSYPDAADRKQARARGVALTLCFLFLATLRDAAADQFCAFSSMRKLQDSPEHPRLRTARSGGFP